MLFYKVKVAAFSRTCWETISVGGVYTDDDDNDDTDGDERERQ